MTPEERKDALVGLLGRLRSNAGSRLPSRSGDEEEFVPKSVIAARAAAAEEASAMRVAALDAAVADRDKPRFAPDDVPLETDPPPTAVPGSAPGSLEEALRQAEQAELDREARARDARIDSAPPTPRGEVGDEAPSIEVGDSAELELDLYDPFDDTTTGSSHDTEALVLETDPPPPPRPPPPPVPARPAAPPPAPPASLTRAIAPPAPPPPSAPAAPPAPPRASPTIESRAVAPPAAGPAPGAKLVPPASPPVPAQPRPPAPSSPGGGPVPPPAPTSPGGGFARPAAARPVAPPPISRVEPSSSQPLSIELPFDEQTEERPLAGDVLRSAPVDVEPAFDDDDELSRTVNMPKRAVDPLAQTAQNPIPAAFERAVLRAEGAHVPPTDAPPAPAAPPTPEAVADDPISSKQPRALDRDDELDEPLPTDDDEAPQSGEVASQRQPATGQRADELDLDGATPSSDQADAVANEAMALLDAEAVPSAPPATRPAVMGRRPVAVTSFLDVLDDALALGD